MNMKIKNDLVERVRKGEACIEHTGFKKDLPFLKQLLQHTFPNDQQVPSGYDCYYFGFNFSWDSSLSLPSSVTAIPLRDFFEEVEEKPLNMVPYYFDELAGSPPKQEVDKVERFDLKSEKFNDFMERDIMELVPFSLVELQEMYIELLIKELNDVVGVAAVHGWKSSNVEEGERLRELINQAKQSNQSTN